MTPSITQTYTPSQTSTMSPTPSYSYSTTKDSSMFFTTPQAPGEISLINPTPTSNQSNSQTPNFIVTPSFSTPAFLFSATNQINNTNYSNAPKSKSIPDYAFTPGPGSYYTDSNMILPIDSQNNQSNQYYTPSNSYSDINNNQSNTQTLASYSYAASPLLQSSESANYYANTPIENSTLFGALQSKYGFYQ